MKLTVFFFVANKIQTHFTPPPEPTSYSPATPFSWWNLMYESTKMLIRGRLFAIVHLFILRLCFLSYLS